MFKGKGKPALKNIQTQQNYPDQKPKTHDGTTLLRSTIRRKPRHLEKTYFKKRHDLENKLKSLETKFSTN